MEVKLIEGGNFVDDRGTLSFVNDFDFDGVKRCYIVSNHNRNFVRAWHGHKKEGKYVMAINGSAIVAAAKIEDLDKIKEGNIINDNIHVDRYVLSSTNPAVLWIPPGYANGFKSLTDDTSLMYFSTTAIGESKDDDFRFPAHFISRIWVIEAR